MAAGTEGSAEEVNRRHRSAEEGIKPIGFNEVGFVREWLLRLERGREDQVQFLFKPEGFNDD